MTGGEQGNRVAPGGDPWADLREFTVARIALGHAGNALPTARLLEFQRDHALARDAVHVAFDPSAVETALSGMRCITVRSKAPDRKTYLQRPDLGRTLRAVDRGCLARGDYDIVFVICDGLSALAVHRWAADLLRSLLPRLEGLSIAPVVLAHHGRVALGDAVALALGARMVVVLIGERPGLSSADSLGAYLTFAPRCDTRDAERNCVSNIRGEGLPTTAAAGEISFLVKEAFRLQLTGIELKADRPDGLLASGDLSCASRVT
ncbi:MAG: ethanolamine ammonia-lyase subunit EutC [Rhodospirillales bacterium]|nr:ethanolamine ammonia-lyase subunit EutC [Rhodospirillales bacterium]